MKCKEILKNCFSLKDTREANKKCNMILNMGSMLASEWGEGLNMGNVSRPCPELDSYVVM